MLKIELITAGVDLDHIHAVHIQFGGFAAQVELTCLAEHHVGVGQIHGRGSHGIDHPVAEAQGDGGIAHQPVGFQYSIGQIDIHRSLQIIQIDVAELIIEHHIQLGRDMHQVVDFHPLVASPDGIADGFQF